MTSKNVKSELIYIGQLVNAAWNGAHATGPPKPVPAGTLCASAAVGSAIGAIAARLKKRRGSANPGISVLIGGVVGLCAGAAWEARGSLGTATRAAILQVNIARDIRWLQKNPIAYG